MLRAMGPDGGGNPWLDIDAPRGSEYDECFARLAAEGRDVHGEATLVASLGLGSVLDAGCGTGRVAIELSRRGLDVAGVALDPAMLAVARETAPLLRWVLADLTEVDLGRRFDGIVMAGNVMIFVTPGTEGTVLANMARHLGDGGLLIAGFSLRPGRLTLDTYDDVARATGLELMQRWSDWHRTSFATGADYAVSVHRRR